MIFDSAIKHTRSYQALAFVVAILATGCSTEPTQKDVQEAPAADLALAYLAAKVNLKIAESAVFYESGPTMILKIGGETVNKDNVEEFRAKYRNRLALYTEAIEQRGYANIAGTYTGKATESCARSNSLLAAVIQQKSHTGIEIKQEGIGAQIVIKFKKNDQEKSIANPAAIAETAIVLVDAANSSYDFKGEIKDQVIVLKPDVSVLNTWPKWAKPPSRDDLENCTVTLERL